MGRAQKLSLALQAQELSMGFVERAEKGGRREKEGGRRERKEGRREKRPPFPPPLDMEPYSLIQYTHCLVCYCIGVR